MALLHRVHEEYWAKGDVGFAWLEAALEDDWCFALRVGLTHPAADLFTLLSQVECSWPQDTQRRRTWDSPTLLRIYSYCFIPSTSMMVISTLASDFLPQQQNNRQARLTLVYWHTESVYFYAITSLHRCT